MTPSRDLKGTELLSSCKSKWATNVNKTENILVELNVIKGDSQIPCSTNAKIFDRFSDSFFNVKEWNTKKWLKSDFESNSDFLFLKIKILKNYNIFLSRADMFFTSSPKSSCFKIHLKTLTLIRIPKHFLPLRKNENRC